MKFLTTPAACFVLALILPIASLPLPRNNAAGNVVAYDLFIANGLIVDGTGRPAYRGDILVRGDRIELITRGTARRLPRARDARLTRVVSSSRPAL